MSLFGVVLKNNINHLLRNVASHLVTSFTSQYDVEYSLMSYYTGM